MFYDGVREQAMKTNQSSGHAYSGWKPKPRRGGYWVIALAVLLTVGFVAGEIHNAVAMERADPVTGSIWADHP